MAKLDSDPSSAAARTSFGVPAKGAAAPATVYNPRVDTLYESFFNLPAVKAAMPPEAPEQAAQDLPKLPGRKPPGSRPAPKHGDVLNMLSRYTPTLAYGRHGRTAAPHRSHLQEAPSTMHGGADCFSHPAVLRIVALPVQVRQEGLRGYRWIGSQRSSPVKASPGLRACYRQHQEHLHRPADLQSRQALFHSSLQQHSHGHGSCRGCQTGRQLCAVLCSAIIPAGQRHGPPE